MKERAMRPFWIHQMAEYLIGIALVSLGLQDPEPLVPSVAGVVVIVNAAMVRGPMGAFKRIGRAVHRWLDLIVMAAIAVGALQPWVDISATGRATMLVVLLPLGFLWFYTDWAERVGRRERKLAHVAGGSGEQVGRTAGRLAGTGYRTASQMIKNRSKQ
jgi:hypothetical protein